MSKLKKNRPLQLNIEATDLLYQKLIYRGSNHYAEKAMLDLFVRLTNNKKKNKKHNRTFINNAIHNIRSPITLKQIRYGRKKIAIPQIFDPTIASLYIIRNLIKNARKNYKGKTFINNLALEILLITKKTGSIYKRRQQMHHIALLNRKFVKNYKLPNF